MSRVARKPIQIPKGVTVEYEDRILTVKGPLGEEKLPLMDDVDLSVGDNAISITAKRAAEDKKIAPISGLARSLISNMVVGVSKGFEKSLDIVGVGYRATKQKND